MLYYTKNFETKKATLALSLLTALIKTLMLGYSENQRQHVHKDLALT